MASIMKFEEAITQHLLLKQLADLARQLPNKESRLRILHAIGYEFGQLPSHVEVSRPGLGTPLEFTTLGDPPISEAERRRREAREDRDWADFAEGRMG